MNQTGRLHSRTPGPDNADKHAVRDTVVDGFRVCCCVLLVPTPKLGSQCCSKHISPPRRDDTFVKQRAPSGTCIPATPRIPAGLPARNNSTSPASASQQKSHEERVPETATRRDRQSSAQASHPRLSGCAETAQKHLRQVYRTYQLGLLPYLHGHVTRKTDGKGVHGSPKYEMLV